MRDVKFDPKGGALAVEVVVGGGKPGAFRFFLWTADRAKQRGVAAGLTIDASPSRFALPVAARRAAGRVLEWNVVIEGEIGDRYDLAIVLLQDERPLRGGRLRYRGKLDSTQTSLVGLATFVARPVK